MGSSKKKKADKQKDFQKPKFKVGKARPKPANHTDTTFKSKAIVINQQSISLDAPSRSEQFTRYLSLLTSRTDSQRKDALSYLTNTVTANEIDKPLPQDTSVIIPKLLPLILDGNHGVRIQLLKLLRTLSLTGLEDHVDTILLYTHAGLNHLAADIQSSTLDILEWAVTLGDNDFVSCPGAWVKTLRCLYLMLGWIPRPQLPTYGRLSCFWSQDGAQGNLLVKILHAMAAFLTAGFVPGATESEIRQMEAEEAQRCFPIVPHAQHLPRGGSGFEYLNLYGPPRNVDDKPYETREERQSRFVESFWKPIEWKLEQLKKEGGEVGRAAKAVEAVIADGMRDYDE